MSAEAEITGLFTLPQKYPVQKIFSYLLFLLIWQIKRGISKRFQEI
jgi:hypothetical protein